MDEIRSDSQAGPDALTLAWQEAATDLAIDVSAPYTIRAENIFIVCSALVHNFGSPAGTIVASLSRPDRDEIRAIARAAGFRYSFLSDDYDTYDRSLFIAVLDDWGWSGAPDEKPAWYQGTSWTA